MDLVRTTPATHRASPLPPPQLPFPEADGLTPGAPYLERAMPLSGATLWTPAGQPAANASYPILMTGRALAAVHAHLAARSEGASSFGFLVGGVYLAPETRVPYIVGESTIPMPWSIGGEHLKSALRQGRGIALEELRQRGGELLGWYHCRVASHAQLSTPDVQAHLACFDQPWQIALVVARGVDLLGGVFRTGPDGARSHEYLPFYELPDPGASGGRLAWANYEGQGVAVGLDRVAPAAPAAPPLVFLPDDSDDMDLEADALPPVAAQPAPYAPLARLAGLWVLGLMAVGAVFGAYRALASGRPAAPAAVAGVAVVAPLERVERVADSVAFAVAAFDTRARLYDGGKMVCADVARGLVEVESRWTAFNAARRAAGGTLDAVQAARDRRLHSDVSAVEQRFTRTGCPRP